MVYLPDKSTKFLNAELSKEPKIWGSENIAALSLHPVFAGTFEFPSPGQLETRALFDLVSAVYSLAVRSAFGPGTRQSIVPTAFVMIERTKLLTAHGLLPKPLTVRFKIAWAIPLASVRRFQRALATAAFVRELEGLMPGSKLQLDFTGTHPKVAAACLRIALAAKRSRHLPVGQRPIAIMAPRSARKNSIGQRSKMASNHSRLRSTASQIIRRIIGQPLGGQTRKSKKP